MKLNADCVRDILIATEENTGYREELLISRCEEFADCIPEQLRKYDMLELLYHIRQCEMAGLIIFGDGRMRVEFAIADLTPYGHEFLANIRKESIWNNVKDISQKVGSSSLKALAQIATSVISEIIKAHCGLS